MSKADEIKDKNFIVEKYKAQNCKDVNIYYFSDKTISITNFKDDKDVVYIDVDIMNKVIKGMKELGWLDE